MEWRQIFEELLQDPLKYIGNDAIICWEDSDIYGNRMSISEIELYRIIKTDMIGFWVKNAIDDEIFYINTENDQILDISILDNKVILIMKNEKEIKDEIGS